MRNLVQLQIGDFQGHTAPSDLVDQAVHFRKRLVVLRGGTHHTHQGMGKALLSVRIALGDAGLHVNIGVRSVVDGHRLVRNVDFHRVQPVRRRDRNNRRVHVHCIRTVVEHRLRQAQGEVQSIAGVLLLTAERLTALMLLRADRRHELALRDALGTARGGGCRLLSAHEGAEATRTPATTATAPKQAARAALNQRYGGGGHRDRPGLRHCGRIRTEASGCVRVRHLRNHTGHGHRLGGSGQRLLGHHIAGGDGVRVLTVRVQLMIRHEGGVNDGTRAVAVRGQFGVACGLNRLLRGDAHIRCGLLQYIADSFCSDGALLACRGGSMLSQHAAQFLVGDLV